MCYVAAGKADQQMEIDAIDVPIPISHLAGGAFSMRKALARWGKNFIKSLCPGVSGDGGDPLVHPASFWFVYSKELIRRPLRRNTFLSAVTIASWNYVDWLWFFNLLVLVGCGGNASDRIVKEMVDYTSVLPVHRLEPCVKKYMRKINQKNSDTLPFHWENAWTKTLKERFHHRA